MKNDREKYRPPKKRKFSLFKCLLIDKFSRSAVKRQFFEKIRQCMCGQAHETYFH